MMGFAGCRSFSGMGFMDGGFWITGIIVLLIVFAAIYLIYNNNHNTNKTTALEILDQEYAKGNVTDDDYKKRKENLQG